MQPSKTYSILLFWRGAGKRERLRAPGIGGAQAGFQDLLGVPADLGRAEALDRSAGLQAREQVFRRAAIGRARLQWNQHFFRLAGPLDEHLAVIEADRTLAAVDDRVRAGIVYRLCPACLADTER